MNKALIAILVGIGIHASALGYDLSGSWSVTLKGDTTGNVIVLPGTLDAAGIGTPDTLTPALKRPQLSHLTRKHRYVGQATYSREFEITPGDAFKPLRFTLERVMWRSKVSIDGHEIPGEGESLVAPHYFELPDGLAAGKHTIEVAIDNTKQYDISFDNLAHAYTDDTQIMWNGILGNMTLEVVPAVEIVDLQVYPSVDNSVVKVVAVISNNTGREINPSVEWQLKGLPGGKLIEGACKVNCRETLDTLSFDVADNALDSYTWSEHTPRLLTFTAAVDDSEKSVTFGMRDIATDGSRLMVNGNPVFLRGTLECCVFPLTGTPPTTRQGWLNTFESARRWGLNHLRFHSWCPPREAFEVADSMGFYLQVECPLWSVDFKAGDDAGDVEMKEFIKREFDRIIKEYGNHPSLCLMTVGNELQHDFDWLNDMVQYMHAKDTRHLYAASSFTFEKGHGGHPEPYDDFIVTQWTDDGWVRGQGVFDKEAPSFNKNYGESTKSLTVPLIQHEIGQYAVYPDISEIERYTGTLRPLNFEAVKEDLEKKGRVDRAGDYLMASGHLAALLYKEEIERSMKTPGISGYQLLGLQDFPGQGTALVGLLNAFWESKGIVEPEWFRQFCNDVVPLASFDKATYLNTEPFSVAVDVSNFGNLQDDVTVMWQLRSDDGSYDKHGELTVSSLERGLNRVGEFTVDLQDISRPQRLTLSLDVADMGAHNTWSVWVYPPVQKLKIPGNVKITRSVDEAEKLLKKGKRVIYVPELDMVDGAKSKFVPVFWSPVHFPKEAGAMGLLYDPGHVALKSFPCDGYTDWQWWHIVKNSRYIDMDKLQGATPILGMVDNFTTNRELSIMWEARVEKGRLLVATVEMPNNESDIAHQQLFNSLIEYVSSDDFDPQGTVTIDQLRGVLKK